MINSMEDFKVQCVRLSKKNNSILYLLEEYLDKKLLEDEKLSEIREVVLNVSAEILKLPDKLNVGDTDEGL